MAAMRDTANLRFSKPVNGTIRNRRQQGERRTLKRDGYYIKVDPRVMAAAKKVQRPGEKLVIVSATEVRLS